MGIILNILPQMREKLIWNVSKSPNHKKMSWSGVQTIISYCVLNRWIWIRGKNCTSTS